MPHFWTFVDLSLTFPNCPTKLITHTPNQLDQEFIARVIQDWLFPPCDTPGEKTTLFSIPMFCQIQNSIAS